MTKQIYKLYNPKLITACCLLGSIIPLYVILLDFPLIDPELRAYYAAGRIVTALISLYFLFEVKVLNKQYELQVPILYISLMAYAIYGQYFMPCYYLAFMQVGAAFAFFFPMNKRLFYPISIISTILMVAMIYYSPATYSLVKTLDLKFRQDAAQGVIILTIIFMIGYRYITWARIKKDLLSQKFSDVGKNSATIIHDLKGIVFSPSVYINLLEKRIKENNTKDLNSLIDGLKSEYEYLTEYIRNVNNLSDVKEGIAVVDCHNVINSTCKVLFKNKMQNTELDVQINGSIIADVHAFKSTIYNLLTNSLEQISTVSPENPKVSIRVENQRLIFKDNAGGFTNSALKQLKDRMPFSEKPQGTGIGLFVIQDYMEDQSGHVKFYNDNKQAVVELIFNKKVTIKDVV